MTTTSDEFAQITLVLPDGDMYELHVDFDDALVDAIQNISEYVPSVNTMYVDAENTGASLPDLAVGDKIEMDSADPLCSPWNGHVGNVYAIDHNQKYPYGVCLGDKLVRWVHRHEVFKVETVAA